MDKVYVIKSFGGEWSDSWEHINGIYSDMNEAIDVAEKHWEKVGNFVNKLPIPYRTYKLYIYTFDVVDYTPDMDDYDDCYIFTDLAGYTKEQWKETYKIIEQYEDHSYCYTSVFEYPLNSEPVNIETIWTKHKVDIPEIDEYYDSDYENEQGVNVNT